jgi:hypothetical protein
MHFSSAPHKSHALLISSSLISSPINTHKNINIYQKNTSSIKGKKEGCLQKKKFQENSVMLYLITRIAEHDYNINIANQPSKNVEKLK